MNCKICGEIADENYKLTTSCGVFYFCHNCQKDLWSFTKSLFPGKIKHLQELGY